jgi:hypothetical protein
VLRAVGLAVSVREVDGVCDGDDVSAAVLLLEGVIVGVCVGDGVNDGVPLAV